MFTQAYGEFALTETVIETDKMAIVPNSMQCLGAV